MQLVMPSGIVKVKTREIVMTREELYRLRSAFLTLQSLAKAKKIAANDMGICRKSSELAGYIDRKGICVNKIVYFYITEKSSSWEHTTGKDCYPVSRTKFRWRYKGLRLRLSLLEHLIACIDKDLGVE